MSVLQAAQQAPAGLSEGRRLARHRQPHKRLSPVQHRRQLSSQRTQALPVGAEVGAEVAGPGGRDEAQPSLPSPCLLSCPSAAPSACQHQIQNLCSKQQRLLCPWPCQELLAAALGPSPGLAVGAAANTAVYVLGIRVLLSGLTWQGVLSSWVLGTLTYSAFGPGGYAIVCAYFIVGSLVGWPLVLGLVTWRVNGAAGVLLQTPLGCAHGSGICSGLWPAL